MPRMRGRRARQCRSTGCAKKDVVWAALAGQGTASAAYNRGVGGKPTRPTRAIGRPAAEGAGRPEATPEAARLQTHEREAPPSRGSVCEAARGAGVRPRLGYGRGRKPEPLNGGQRPPKWRGREQRARRAFATPCETCVTVRLCAPWSEGRRHER